MSRPPPGTPPAVPPWGQEPGLLGPELARRVASEPGASEELALVLGAGGAFAPDLVHALRLRGHPVLGADVQLTYPVEGVPCRHLDLADPAAVRAFVPAVAAWAEATGLRLGPVFDLAAVQTSPRGERPTLAAGKQALIDALCDLPGDRPLFYMSSAEVYGAPPGAPYREDATKAPINPYGQRKWEEEQAMLAAHGRPTASGTLRVTALRCWTLAMVREAPGGEVLGARNYNDPMIAVAQRLALAGVRVPVVDPDLRCVFHLSEEVAEITLRMGTAPPDAPLWGRPYNCLGRPATHGRLRDVLYEAFAELGAARPLWGGPLRVALGRGRLPRRLLAATAFGFQRLGALGARDVGGRLPFLYRDTHLDTSALQRDLGDRLTDPAGGSTEEAVRRLCAGIRAGGPDALWVRRYRRY